MANENILYKKIGFKKLKYIKIVDLHKLTFKFNEREYK
jgi:hypothetical protein